MNPNLLRECAQHLIETPKFIQGGEVSGGSTSPSSASSHTSTTSSTRYNNSIQSGSTGSNSAVPNKAPSVSESARQEHNWIFEYRTPGSSRQSLNSSRRTHANGRQAANASWSCSFICLASADQCCPPSTIERIEVYIEWAGEKKKTFSKEGNVRDVHEKTIECFPALHAGYELLRARDGHCLFQCHRTGSLWHI